MTGHDPVKEHLYKISIYNGGTRNIREYATANHWIFNKNHF